MRDLGDWAKRGNPDDYFNQSLGELHHFVREITRTEHEGSRDYDGIEARLSDFLRTWRSEWVGFRSRIEGFPKQELLERRNALKAMLVDFVEQSGADIAPRLRDDLWEVIADYERLKERAGCVDFLDLLLRARDLVRDNAEVRRELQQRFSHVLVDEFQDTDPLQAEILMLIAADDPDETDWRKAKPAPGKLFVVGDPKQSIYRFRRADVALYEAVKRQVVDSGGDLVELNVSFRAVPEIQDAVNSAFAPLMGGSSGEGLDQGEKVTHQARYVRLMPSRQDTIGQPPLIALPVPAPYGDFGRIVNFRIDESQADVTGAFVEWLVRESGWRVSERDDPSNLVPVQPRHVCLLFRRFKSFNSEVTRPYVRALEARNLPHLLVGGTGFHSREEVEAIRNSLSAIERPDDELSVFATLRGPLFALNDSQLLAHRSRFGTFNPFLELPEDLPEQLKEVADALYILRGLHRGRNGRPIADTIGRLLASTRAHAALAIWPEGEQALANVSRLMDLARRAERTGITSFRAFVDWLSEQAERGEAGDAPIIEDGAQGVRLMTVHKSKGLEFPVVILCDLTARDVREPSRWTDPERGACAMTIADCSPPELLEHGSEELEREREEAIRVLYVAATRARDMLVIPVIGDSRQSGWLAALNPIAYPARGSERTPLSQDAVGCPGFGGDSLSTRTPGLVQPRTSVMPGVHGPEIGDHKIVWFDPNCLRLGAEETTGLLQTRLLESDEKGGQSDAGIRAYNEWRSKRLEARTTGSEPSVSISTATELSAGLIAAGASQVVVESVATGPRRVHGKRFGTLVHAMLSLVDLDAGHEKISKAADLQRRLIGATDEEAMYAVEVVKGALSHPLLQRALEAQRAGHCRREAPVSLVRDDGLIVEGIVDLAYYEIESDCWTVLDFKTDIELEGRLEEYRNQVALYADAIRLATGSSSRGVLLRV